jgi:Flp pilus assembly protein TadB
MLRTALLLAVLPLSLAACATMTPEEQAARQEQRAQQTQTAEEGGLRCRTIRQTGSRVGNRVCMSDEEWEAQRRDSQEAHDRLDQGNVRPASPDQGFGG